MKYITFNEYLHITGNDTNKVRYSNVADCFYYFKAWGITANIISKHPHLLFEHYFDGEAIYINRMYL